MNIKDSILQVIGKTPLVRLNNINDTHAEILVKIEGMNPGGSVKDRVAANIIERAEKEGKLDKDTVVIEATSGNTGIGLAMTCAVKGYELKIVMPDTMSIERRQLVEAYGAEIILVDGALGMKGCLDMVEELKSKYEKVFVADQFKNPANPEAHANTTAVEIYEDLEGQVDIFLTGTGTGGSFTGTTKALKERIPTLKAYALEPAESPLLSKGYIGPHKLQGLGMSAGFVPPVFEEDYSDGIVTATYEQALIMTNRLAREEGILAGISSGAALHAAMELGRLEENKGKRIVVLLMDTGERYLSSQIFGQV